MTDVVEKAIYSLSVTGVNQIDAADRAVASLAVTEERADRVRRTASGGIERLIARYDSQARALMQLQRE